MIASDFIYLQILTGARRSGCGFIVAQRHAERAIERYNKNQFDSVEGLINESIKNAVKENG